LKLNSAALVKVKSNAAYDNSECRLQTREFAARHRAATNYTYSILQVFGDSAFKHKYGLLRIIENIHNNTTRVW